MAVTESSWRRRARRPGGIAARRLPRSSARARGCAAADGSLRPSRYLDYAATAPALRAAADAALELLPYYGSIHRGAGLESRARPPPTRRARAPSRPSPAPAPIRSRLRAQHDRGAQPARPLPPRGRARALDPGRAPRQHAALAPPRGRPAAVHALGRRAADAQRRRRSPSGRYDLFAVSGASNVTGEILPIRELADARAPPRRRDLRRRRAARAARADRHGGARDRPPRALRPQALRAVRRRRADRARAAHRRGRAAAARRRRRRARARRPRRLGRRARALRGRHPERLRRRSPSAPPATCSPPTAWACWRVEEQTLGALLRERLAAVPGLRVLAQWPGARRARASPWPRSASRGSRRPRSPAGSPRSTRSPCAPARSARIRSCGTCAACARGTRRRRRAREPRHRLRHRRHRGLADALELAARRARRRAAPRRAAARSPAPVAGPARLALTLAAVPRHAPLRTPQRGARTPCALPRVLYAPGRTRTCPLHIRRGRGFRPDDASATCPQGKVPNPASRWLGGCRALRGAVPPHRCIRHTN